MTRYGIYLMAKLDGVYATIRFPVNPRELKIEYPEDNERFNVLGLGEIVQPRKPGLATVSWDNGLFPGAPDGDYVLNKGDFRPPRYYIDFLNRCKREQIHATLTIDRYLEDGTPYAADRFTVVVEDFEISEKGGETGDFYYSITLTEYRDYTPVTATLIPDPEMPNAATAVAERQRTVPQGQLTVGARVTVNGRFCYTSYGGKPYGNGNGRTAVVGRIITTDPGRACPILLKTETGGLLGWCARDAVAL